MNTALDTDKMEARLPEGKLSRIISIFNLFESKHSISKKELLSLLGHLNFASRVIPQGRSFVSYLLSLATTVKALHHHVRLDKECRLDIAMLRRFLKYWNGVAMFLEKDVTKATDLIQYTDAAATLWFGGFFKDRWFQERWSPELMLKDNTQLSMEFLELYPIVYYGVLSGKARKSCFIVIMRQPSISSGKGDQIFNTLCG